MKTTMIAIMIWLVAAAGVGAADEYAMLSAAAAERQADWAGLAAGISAASLIVSVVALFFLFRSLQQTQEALEVTRKLGHTQARAYVEPAEISVATDGKAFDLTLQNSGETPSGFVAVGLEALYLSRTDMLTALTNRGETPPQWSWGALGADKSFKVRVTPRRGEQPLEDFRNNSGENCCLLVYGTIVYRDVFGEYFKTDFAFFTEPNLGHFERPFAFIHAYKPLTSDEHNRWLHMDV